VCEPEAAKTSGQLVQFWRNERYQGLSTFDVEGARFREHVVPCSGRTVDWPEIVALRAAATPVALSSGGSCR
jgi:hypothetical protein